MANTKQAEKRIRQNETRRVRNKSTKSRIKTALKKFEEAVKAKDSAAAEVAFAATVKLLDTAVGKGVFHKNTIARKKSRMAKLLKTIA